MKFIFKLLLFVFIILPTAWIIMIYFEVKKQWKIMNFSWDKAFNKKGKECAVKNK